MRDSQAEIKYNLAIAFDNVAKEISGVRVNKDIEFLHRMRVASRRLNNTLWAYRHFFSREKVKKLRSEVKEIIRLLGRARDLDTQAVFVRKAAGDVKDEKLSAELKALLGIILKNRRDSQVDVLKALRLARSLTPRKSLVICADADVLDAACKTINRRLKQFLKLSNAVHRKNTGKALHKMRIGAKHLRYTLENFSFLNQKKIGYFVGEARLIQQTLGDMHNYIVWRAEALLEAKKYPHTKKAVIYFVDLCSKHAAKSYKEFLMVYYRQCKEEAWVRLKEIVAGLK